MKSLSNSVKLISSLLFGGAALLYFGTQVFIFGHVAGFTNSVQNAGKQEDPFKKAKLNIINHKHDHTTGFKLDYLAMAQFNDIDSHRYINFSALVPISSLLEAGERRPTGELEKVFAKTRAIYYAREECKRVLDTIANECEVASSSGTIRDNRVRITGRLQFVQRSEFGDIDPSTSWSFETVDNDLAKRNETTTPTGAENKRKSLYRKAIKDCSSIKSREGNCAITSITADTGTRERDGRMRVSGRATYSFLSKIKA